MGIYEFTDAWSSWTARRGPAVTEPDHRGVYVITEAQPPAGDLPPWLDAELWAAALEASQAAGRG